MHIVQTLANLIGGISQQPMEVRLPNQLAICDGWIPDPVEGLTRRPPLQLIKSVTGQGLDCPVVTCRFSPPNLPQQTVFVQINQFTGALTAFTDTGVPVLVKTGGRHANAVQYLVDSPGTPQSGPRYSAVSFGNKAIITNHMMPVDSLAPYKNKGFSVNSPTMTGTITVGSTVYTAGTDFVVVTGDPVATAFNIAAAINRGVANYCAVQIGSGVRILPRPGFSSPTLAAAPASTAAITAVETGSLAEPDMQKATIEFRGGFLSTTYVVTATITDVSNLTLTYSASYTTSASTVDTSVIAAGLAAAWPAPATTAGLICATAGNKLFFVYDPGHVNAPTYHFTGITCSIASGVVVTHRLISAIGDLPAEAVQGQIVKLQSKADAAAFSSYYRFRRTVASTHATIPNPDGGKGIWEEWNDEYAREGWNPSTMPIVLIYYYSAADSAYVIGQHRVDGGMALTDGFTQAEIDGLYWKPRLVGDGYSNAIPPIVGKPIRDSVFFRGRLNLISDNCYVASEVDDVFNLFRSSSLTLLDGDRIATGVGGTTNPDLIRMVPVNEAMLLVGSREQYSVRGDPVLTPKTVQVTSASRYDMSTDMRPAVLGHTVLVTSPHGDKRLARALIPNALADRFVLDELTPHCPNYLNEPRSPAEPVYEAYSSYSGITGIIPIDTAGVTIYLTGREVYLNRWVNGTEGRVLNSWSRLMIRYSWRIVAYFQDGTTVYFVVAIPPPQGGDVGLNNTLHLCKMSFQRASDPTGIEDVGYLDLRMTAADVTVTVGPADVGITLPAPIGPFGGSPQMVMVSTSNSDPARPMGASITPTAVSATSLRVPLGWHTDFFLGYTWKATARLNTLCMRSKEDAPLNSGRTQVKSLWLYHNDSGYYRVEVTPKLREVSTTVMTAKQLGLTQTGGTVSASGKLTVPVQSKNDRVTIDIISDSHLKANIINLDWSAEYVELARRL